jgi:signal transduction histidine kinase
MGITLAKDNLANQPDSESIAIDKNEISTRILRPALIYLERKYKRPFLVKFVRETGMEISMLEDGKKYVSFDYFSFFLERLASATDNFNAVYESGENFISHDACGSILGMRLLVRLFANPLAVFEKIERAYAVLSLVSRFEILSKGKNRLIVRLSMSEKGRQTRLTCEATKGQLASVPLIWGLPPARIKDLHCAAEGADSCIYEISWIGQPRRNIVFYLIAGGFVALELVLLAFGMTSLLGIREIVMTAGACAIVLLAHMVFQSGRLLEEYKNIQEERTKTLEQSLHSIKNEYAKLQEANLQIVEKANKMSILNYIAEEMSKVGQEHDLLLLILKIIVDCIGFDRGYYACYTTNYDLVSDPVFVEKIVKESESEIAVESYFIVKTKPGAYKLFKNRRPQISRANEVFDTSLGHEILFIPIPVYNNFIYLLCFDTFYSGSKIKEKNMQFFSTVERQVEISLNNIYAIKSAHNVLSSIPSSIVVFDKNSLNISYVNSAYLKNFKVEIEDVQGENILTFLKISEDYKTIFTSQIDDAMRRTYLSDQELVSGNRILGYTLFKMPGSIAGKSEIGMIMKDITDQKEFHEQLIRGEKLAALGTLASGIAHEINNPLYGILGTAEVIVDEAEGEEIKLHANEIIDYTMQASDIVKDLSAYSRSLREEKTKDVNINDVLDETLRMISYSPKFIDIKVEKEFAEVPSIFGIGGEIRQVFMNIMNNAIQAMDGRGSLRLVSKVNDNFIVTTIEDSGPGIPESLLSQIFDPFFTTKPPGEGTGIGLTIVYRIVTKYNGFVSVASKLGEGTIFTIKFPLNKEKK